MDKELIENGVKRSATTAARVAAFQEAGFKLTEIAQVVDVTPAAVKGWLENKYRPRKETFATLDVLRGALGRLMTRGLEPEEAVSWLMSVDYDAQPPVSPLQVMRSEPATIFKMIDEEFPVS